MSLPRAAKPAPKVYPTYLSPESKAYIAGYAADLKARREHLRREEQARRFVEALLRDVQHAGAPL